MDKKLVATLNEQINHEFFSAYLYLAMAAWSEKRNLPGFAHWMRVQAKEEVGHGMKIFGFLVDRGETVVLDAIKKPAGNFESPRDVFAMTLEHEQKVTALINRLYDLSSKLNDQATTIFLQWFVTEQVEEEKNASSILETLKMLKPDSSAIFMLDHQLSKRA